MALFYTDGTTAKKLQQYRGVVMRVYGADDAELSAASDELSTAAAAGSASVPGDGGLGETLRRTYWECDYDMASCGLGR